MGRKIRKKGGKEGKEEGEVIIREDMGKSICAAIDLLIESRDIVNNLEQEQPTFYNLHY